MRGTIKSLALLLLLLAAIACGSGTVRKLEITGITGVKVLRVDGDTAEIELEGTVRNTHRSGARIRNFSYEISVAGTNFAGGSHPASIQLPGKSDVRVRLPLTVRLDRLTGEAWEGLFQADLRYHLSGKAAMEEPLRREMRLDVDDSIRGPDSLSATLASGPARRLVTFDDVDLTAVHLTTLDTKFRVRLRNPFPSALTIDELSYELQSGGKPIGRGSASRPMVLEPGLTLVRLPVSFRTSKLLGGLLESVPRFEVPGLTIAGRAVLSHNGRSIELLFRTLEEYRAFPGLDLGN
jgi:LEA14-like dessication related protein